MNESKTPRLPKRLIKSFIKKALLNKTPAGEKVELSKSTPAHEEDFPAIRIYGTGETSNVFDSSQKRYVRILNISVECYAIADTPDELDQALEELGDAVEAEMHRDETFGKVADDVEYVGCDYQLEPVATAPIGVMIQRYSVKFYTYAQRLDGECLDTFKGADIEWAVGHNNEPTDNIVDAVDAVNVP